MNIVANMSIIFPAVMRKRKKKAEKSEQTPLSPAVLIATNADLILIITQGSTSWTKTHSYLRKMSCSKLER
jgi:hypothetical protein